MDAEKAGAVIRHYSPTAGWRTQSVQGRGQGPCGSGRAAGAASVAHRRDAATGVAGHCRGTGCRRDRPYACPGDTTTMRRLPPSTHPGTAAEAEQTLATAARRFDPAALSQIGERRLANLDPAGSAPSDEPETIRDLRGRTDPDGVVSLTGRLDPEGGARVLEVLDSLNGRRPPVEGAPDMRDSGRRNADALVEAMSSLLGEGELPARGGQRPYLVLTMGLNDLIDGLGTAVLVTGGQLCAAEARRLAYDSCVVPMVLGSDSMPLDVGRQHRLATAAIRDSLAYRDKGCAFPGCHRPPRYCEAHHMVAWLDGGERNYPTRPLARCTSSRGVPRTRRAGPARRSGGEILASDDGG